MRPLPVGLDRSPAVALFLQAGLGDVVTHPKTLVLRDLDVADRVYSFFSTAERLAEAGSSVAAMRIEVGRPRTADAKGRFFTSYTGFLVSGIRPGGFG